MLVIRLKRIGKKHHPTFRFIISEKTKDTKGDFLEDLGFYDPHPSPSKIELKEDRVKHWLSKGAQTSDTVYNLLVEKGIIKGEKKKVWKPKKKKKKEGEEEDLKPETKPAEEKQEEKKEEKPAAKQEDKQEAEKQAKPVEEKKEEKLEVKSEGKKEEKKPEEKK